MVIFLSLLERAILRHVFFAEFTSWCHVEFLWRNSLMRYALLVVFLLACKEKGVDKNPIKVFIYII
ncbi:MAG: hypothetical protein D3908_08955 [Candidatus Electrothrix sp. AUS4]|nr:hypothetical protein [Candidatus Electrothrix sp. AUS4]